MFSSLRRMATGRAKAKGRRTATLPALANEASHRRPLRDAYDVEAVRRPAHRLAQEADHRAGFWPFNNNENNENNELIDEGQNMLENFMDFYNGKLEELKEKEGGASHMPISGNLYMYKSLAPFADSTGLFLKKQTVFVDIALGLIIILQILAPACMLISAVIKIDFGGENGYFGIHQFLDYKYGDGDKGLSHLFQRILGLFFLVLFLMNGLYVLNNDQAETVKVTELCLLLKTVSVKLNESDAVKDGTEPPKPRPKTRWLWFGAAINSLCLMLCSLAMVFVFIIEEGPKDLVLDAFGLSFLYNLDDIGGDLAFLDEKWDEDFMGDVYGALYDDKDNATLFAEASKKREETWTPDTIFDFSRVIVWIGLIVLPLVYCFLEMSPNEFA